ncbi:MAG: hypothetical protein PHE79_11200 [Eubacteriales bacterium]|nr:hypothetical protein [Eubacteriales bacterium]
MDESKRVLPGSSAAGAQNGNSKEAQKPIDQVITNLNTFRNPGDGSLNEYLMALETYEIVKDGEKYEMTLRENRGTKWIHIPPAATEELGEIYLMKDGKIVELTGRSPQENENGEIYSVAIYYLDITQIDYIVSLDTIEHHALLIANPFKN